MSPCGGKPISKKRRSRNRFKDIPEVEFDIRGSTGQRPAPRILPYNEHRSADSHERSSGWKIRESTSPPVDPFDPQDCEPDEADMATDSVRDASSSECSDAPSEVLGSGWQNAEEILDLTGCELMHVDGTLSNSYPNSLKVSKWQEIWGIIMTSGTRRVGKRHYQSMRTVADTFGRIGLSAWNRNGESMSSSLSATKKITCLPHFSTIHLVLRPIVYNILGPRAREVFEHVDMTKAGARFKQYSAEGQPQAPVRIIVPSEYARADMSTGPVFKEMCSTSLEFCSTEEEFSIPSVAATDCVDIWPLVGARKWFYGSCRRFSVDADRSNGTSSTFAEMGDVVEIELPGSLSVQEALRDCFHVSDGTRQYLKFLGEVSYVWAVHHSKRRNDQDYADEEAKNLRQPEKNIVNRLRFLSYCSPSDSLTTTVPDLPVMDDEDEDGSFDYDNPVARKKVSPQMAQALKERRAALKARKREEELAWRGWVNPLLKPGDTVALLRSVIGPRESGPYFFCLVNRFWVEREERDRHLFWVSTAIDADIDDCSNVRNYSHFIDIADTEPYRDILNVSLQSKHPGKRGLENYAPVSSTGTLANGEKYFVYRFLLFWDGFEIESGSSASGEGFYLLCLNLPIHARKSANAVRVITLTPPGVKSASVFERIREDIVNGMVDGFLDYDADGEKRRIFLDLVGFISDTPALNSSLDVLGHTARCFCHLCRFCRHSSTVVGGRYTQFGYNALFTPFSRTYHAHAAVRDSGAREGTCRLLGISYHSDEEDLSIHSLRSAMLAAQKSIPLTSYGVPVVPGEIDPYRSCLIAPDHLLTGHARDCVNSAFRLLPSKTHRRICEAYMIGLLDECELPVQARLFDHKRLKLHQMSMTELYAVIMVAPQGFRVGCAKADADTSIGKSTHPRCLSAIGVVCSCANLIADIVYLPEKTRDGRTALAAFNAQDGWKHVENIQKKASDHIQKVEGLCSMSDEDFSMLNDPSTPKSTKLVLSKDHTLALRAIKTVDKPNLHRLQELVLCTLPMLGYVCRIGELVLEKAHQPLKRAIKMSNNKDPQLSSMKSITVNDWQGRLTLLIPDPQERKQANIRGCFRLLAGREAMPSVADGLTEKIISDVLGALGPDACVPAELRSQSQSVLSPKSGEMHVTWTVKGNVEDFVAGKEVSSDHRKSALRAFQAAHRSDAHLSKITFFDTLHTQHNKGGASTSLCRGDIVEIAVWKPSDYGMHFPFLVQTNCISAPRELRLASGPSFWCISALFKQKDKFGTAKLCASLLPCHKQMETSDGYDVYSVGEQISLGQIDPYVRKVAVIHHCNPSTCAQFPSKAGIDHGLNWKPLQGGIFQVRCWKDGYPPRQG